VEDPAEVQMVRGCKAIAEVLRRSLRTLDVYRNRAKDPLVLGEDAQGYYLTRPAIEQFQAFLLRERQEKRAAKHAARLARRPLSDAA
jgi:hypothetical protein